MPVSTVMSHRTKFFLLLAAQAGYLMCEPDDGEGAPLHCVVRIIPAQVQLGLAAPGILCP